MITSIDTVTQVFQKKKKPNKNMCVNIEHNTNNTCLNGDKYVYCLVTVLLTRGRLETRPPVALGSSPELSFLCTNDRVYRLDQVRALANCLGFLFSGNFPTPR